MKIYKVNQQGWIEVTDDGGQQWKLVEGAVLNEQAVAHAQEVNQLRLLGKSMAEQSTQLQDQLQKERQLAAQRIKEKQGLRPYDLLFLASLGLGARK